MSDLNDRIPIVGPGFEIELVTDEQAASIGNQLHLLDLLVELIDHYGFQDMHIDEYARSLIFPDSSVWPFGVFPEVEAVQDMYMRRTGMYAYHSFQTRNGTWTR